MGANCNVTSSQSCLESLISSIVKQAVAFVWQLVKRFREDVMVKMVKTVLGSAALGVWMTGAALADPAFGLWKTEVDDGAYAHVEMGPCGENICGTIAQTFNSDGEYSSPNKGKQIVRGMSPKGGGAYEGKVWRPSNDKIYVGKMQVSGKQLKLKGCLAVGWPCSSQTWTKLN